MRRADHLRIQFDELDQYVSKATIHDCYSYTRLKEYILAHCPSGASRALSLFRGLLMWLRAKYTSVITEMEQDSLLSHFRPSDSPLYLVKQFQEQKLSINHLINVVCSKFDIRSTKVRGTSKIINDNPHSKTIDIRVNEQVYWNAIEIDGNWYLLNTDMFFPESKVEEAEKAKARPEPGHNCSENEKTISPRHLSMQLEPGLKDSLGHPESAFDEFWFLTSPKIYINFCFPDDPSQQFLPCDEQISYDDFINRPFVHPAFFRYNFDILSDKTCKLVAKEGQCSIDIYTEKSIASSIDLSCDLYRITESDSYLLSAEVTSVILNKFRTKEIFTFEFQFVEEGRYFAVVYCREVDATLQERCCDFEIESTDLCEANSKPGYISANTSNTFGIGPAAIRAGIMASSQVYPKSTIDLTGCWERLQQSLYFHLSEETLDTFKYQVTLEACNIFGVLKTFTDGVSCKVDKTKAELTVSINVQHDREFLPDELLLTLKARNKEEDLPNFVPVYYHLFTTRLSNEVLEKERRKMEKKRKQIRRKRYIATKKDEELRLQEEIHILKAEIIRLVEGFPEAAEGIALDDIVSAKEDSKEGAKERNEEDASDENSESNKDKQNEGSVKDVNDRNNENNIPNVPEGGKADFNVSELCSVM